MNSTLKAENLLRDGALASEFAIYRLGIEMSPEAVYIKLLLGNWKIKKKYRMNEHIKTFKKKTDS